ncbi:MAG TPA: 30S ribosome-binding factor RbfA [Ruminococcaceae bacterium]|jgi:ribosome-binding factor A|nr:30S ribosome-binding factor RbfA [Oscillospiraceae bacterium]HBJ25107.1 30S ribosome-binding factor RbfA [Oscillospiraceae bacterium]
MANFNLKRLSEDIKRELSSAVSGVKDPRVSKNFVTVTHVELTSDLSYCKVHIACLGGEGRTAKAVEGMTAASGYFKKAIAARIRMRKMPELIFLPDNSLEYSAHIEEILAKLPKPAQQESAADEQEESDEEN